MTDNQTYYTFKWPIIGAILVCTLLIMYALHTYKPQAKIRPPRDTTIQVEVFTLKETTHPILIAASGSVHAMTRSKLTAHVKGEITYVSDALKRGGAFNKDDILLHIDNRPYSASMRAAKASLLQAQVQYSQEKAYATQAQKDWQRLGFTEQANDLVLRKPQLEAAKAHLISAQAQHERASLDMQHTRIRAPFKGYTIGKHVNLGQYVSVGTPLGEIYADTGLEVDLSLTQHAYTQIDFTHPPQVTLQTTFAGITHNWPAQIVRADNIFDATTRQIKVIASVLNTTSDQGLELKVGQYVHAYITARTIDNALVIPNSSIREGRYVYMYQNGQLFTQNITLVWQDNDNSLVSDVPVGTKVVLTSLGSIVDGTQAQVSTSKAIYPESKSNFEVVAP